uniref:NAD(P)(+)--arginine ADP-ribosyltransferase n=1 Tax=Timema shepardi TaxID=629360 RepID=A0A7R9FY34_TIMSH|nr:unnamed protein product [Timema shepardi]
MKSSISTIEKPPPRLSQDLLCLGVFRALTGVHLLLFRSHCRLVVRLFWWSVSMSKMKTLPSFSESRRPPCDIFMGGTYAPFNSRGKLTFRFNKFSSCSEDESVALKFVNNGGTVYVILDAESVNIQPHSQFLGQKEHLIHPTTEFIVEGVEDNVLKWGMKSGRGSYYALTLVTLRAIRETPTVVPSLSHGGQATPRPQMLTVNLDVKTPKPLETNYDLIVIDDSTLNPSRIVTAKLDPGKSLGAIISSPDQNRMSGSNISGTKPPSSMGKNYDSIVCEIVSTAPPVKPIAIAPSAQPITTTPSAQPITNPPSAQPIAIAASAQPITTTPSAQPITTTPSAQPITTTPSAQPITTTPSAQPITVVPRAIDSVRPLSDHENSVRVHITDEENTKADQGSNWISCLLDIFCCCSR